MGTHWIVFQWELSFITAYIVKEIFFWNVDVSKLKFDLVVSELLNTYENSP